MGGGELWPYYLFIDIFRLDCFPREAFKTKNAENQKVHNAKCGLLWDECGGV